MNFSNLVGIGLRHTHFPEILERIEKQQQINVGWFEAISENFINTRGRPFNVLMKVRELYPIALHGVSMNIASHEEVNMTYLKKLKELYQIIEPELVSDHLCWTGVKASNIHNLLPFPYTSENLDFLVGKVQKIQDYLGRPLAFENLSAYFKMTHDQMSEAEFLKELSLRSGCKILLDLNNVYVNAVNQSFDPYSFIDLIPFENVTEIHLAGHSDRGEFLFDTHSEPVKDEVWDLYRYVCQKHSKPTLIEWDEDIPSLDRVLEEATKAMKMIKK